MYMLGYVRVSTEEQQDSGLSLASQQDKIRRYCELYELNLLHMYSDVASGKSIRRRGLMDALSQIGMRRAEGLIVAKLDRLTRSVRDLGDLLEDYFQEQSSLVVVAERVDTRTASGRLVLNLLTSVAQWERETISERTRDALRAKRAKGEKTGGDVPYGYELQPDGRTLCDHPEEQKVISMMRSWKVKGYTSNAIARRLNQSGYRAKRGGLWTNVQVYRALNAIGLG
jgi:DNA invertase Pin-like site-specific DNA recombinase